MTIDVTAQIIGQATRASIECPILLAARAAGLDVQMVGVGTEHPHSEAPAIRMYLMVDGEAIIQPLPTALVPIIRAYDRTGLMDPLSFDIPLDAPDAPAPNAAISTPESNPA